MRIERDKLVDVIVELINDLENNVYWKSRVITKFDSHTQGKLAISIYRSVDLMEDGTETVFVPDVAEREIRLRLSDIQYEVCWYES